MFDSAAIGDAQKNAVTFRVILNAMARPGRVELLPQLIDQVDGAYASSLAVLLSLGDHLTSIYLDETLRTAEIEKLIRFHTGSRLTNERQVADFALLSAAAADAHLEDWKLGSLEYPDQSTTLIIQTPSLQNGDTQFFSGPGLNTPKATLVAALPECFWQTRAGINAAYPLGLDIIFASPDHIMGCPRTTRVSRQGTA